VGGKSVDHNTAGGRTELAILNANGRRIDLKTRGDRRVACDARAVYVDLDGPARRASAVDGTFLTMGEESIFSGAARRNFCTAAAGSGPARP
jgi:hypothetical protein